MQQSTAERMDYILTTVDRLRITLRGLYVARFCSEREVQRMMRVQNSFPKHDRLITKYFEVLSFFGEPPFYTFFIPFLFWIGLPAEAAFFCFMMSVTTYFVGNTKDLCACPRPPCPPLRRAGTESHGIEYGCPSSHIGLGLMCAYHVIICCASLWPKWEWLMWMIGLSFIVQTGISRVYLGLHWFGDLLSGAVIFFFCLALEALFLRHWMVDIVMTSPRAPWYVFALSHFFSRFCVIPKDPCPCYEDTVRFIGAAAGATFGGWLSVRHHESVRLTSELSAEQKGALIFSVAFWIKAVIGIVLIAICKTVVSVGAPKLLKPLYLALSGAYRDRVPRALRPLYNAVCLATGLFLCCGYIPRHGVLHNHKLRHEDPPTLSPPSSVVVDGVDAAPSASTAAVHVVTVKNATVTSTSSEDGASNTTLLFWPVRMHNFWWMWDIHTKSLAYIAVGFSATYLLPFVLRFLRLE